MSMSPPLPLFCGCFAVWGGESWRGVLRTDSGRKPLSSSSSSLMKRKKVFELRLQK